MPWRFRLSMALAVLGGLAYLVWLAWAEGWRLWVVAGVMVLVAGLGGAVHLAMGLARAHDGLEESGPVSASGGDRPRAAVDRDSRPADDEGPS